MSMTMGRRAFLNALGVLPLAASGTIPFATHAAAKARVVVIGGGYGGAIAARYLKMGAPEMEVVLVEKNRHFISCPFSNEVLAGDATLAHLTFGYDNLARLGIKVVYESAEVIDADKKTLLLGDGSRWSYDHCIVSPGIDFKWGSIEGYDPAAAERMPHAWKAGPQTLLLRRQLETMPDGGTVIIRAPANPFRCPPGPYERACQIAHYLKRHKPRSKVIILDDKDAFSKMALFKQGWQQHYPGMITWISGAEDGKVLRVDPKTMKVYTEFSEYHADVVNIIPQQQAGKIATQSGLVDGSGWCPVDPMSFESKVCKDVFVVGDASIATPMPKSAYAANTQAKVAAAAVLARVFDQPLADPAMSNTCYSLITPEHGISVAAIYRVKEGKIVEVPNSGGVSPIDASPAFRHREAHYARSWFHNITQEMFG